MAGFDKLLHYKVPEAFRAEIRAGSLVRVPISSRHHLGLVMELNAQPDCALEKLKLISDVLHDYPALTPDLLGLARWMHTYYAARMETVLEAMIPAAVRDGARLKTEKYLSLNRILTAEELGLLRKKAPQQARLGEFLQGQIQPVKISQPQSYPDRRRVRPAPEEGASAGPVGRISPRADPARKKISRAHAT